MNTKRTLRSLIWKAAGAGILALFPMSAHAQSAATSPDANAPASSDVVVMNPFEAATDRDYGYRKAGSVTASRTGELTSQMPQAVEIISGDLLNDFNANYGNDVFRYSSSVMVSENEVGQADLMNLRGFALPRYYNGVSLASSSSLVPIDIWDNVDRIEVVKGPVGLYFPNSTPNGVANFITKKPEFTNSASLDLTYGSYDYQKALLDVQQTLLNNRIGIRVIASESTRGSGYRDGSPTRYTFESPSVTIRPFKGLEITGEMDYLTEKVGYQGGAQAWNFSMNPLWQQDVTNPSANILSYFESHNNLASAAAAQTFIKSRWSAPNTTAGVAMTTWSADMLAITGTAPFLYTTQNIPWSIYSPRGDRIDPVSLESTYGGYTPTYEASATETPFPGLSLRYHWVDQLTEQQFVRQIIQPNTNGYQPDGRVNSLDASSVALQGLNYEGNTGRWARSDTQQWDLSFERAFWGIKNQLAGGAEYLRGSSANWVYPVNFANAGTVNGLTGVAIYQNYNPWTGAQPPDVYNLVSGAPTLSGHVNLSKDHQFYLSERASFLDDRIHALVGVNSYHVDPSGPQNTPLGNKNTEETYGLIADVYKGFSVFASKSASVQFTSAQSITGVGVLPSDNQHTLNNEADKGIEVGAKSSWNNDELSGSISYYDDERNGVVESNTLANLSDPRNAISSATVQYNVNGGLYVSRGIDEDLTWTPNLHLQVVLNYNYSIKAVIASDPSVNSATPGTLAYQREFDYPLSHSPKNRANLVAKYNFLGDTLLKNVSIGGAVRYSSTYLITNSNTSLLWVPTETALDAFVIYRTKVANIPTTIKVNVTNITNVRDDYTWGDGITEYVSVTLRF